MDKKSENNPSNLWTRRSNSSKLSLSTNKSSYQNDSQADDRSTPSGKRYTSLSGSAGKNNPFSAPLSTATAAASVASPTGAGASSAFGLGSGAFASFGGAGKTPRTPGSAFDFSSTKNGSAAGAGKQDTSSTTGSDKDTSSDKDTAPRRPPARKSLSSVRSHHTPSTSLEHNPLPRDPAAWPLKHSWVIYYRPPTGKTTDYEKSIKPLCRISTVQEFWTVYSHLRRPSQLPTVSDYHFFRAGTRPVWEDEANKKGGKWIMRLKKGVADRFWEDLLLAIIGDQFSESGDEVCGLVVSVRQGEDVFSLWTKGESRGGKMREGVKRVLGVGGEAVEVSWRSHGESIVLKGEGEKRREEKMGADGKRRGTLSKGDVVRSTEEE
ncbi:hypothetical protein LTR78_000012 [Recurvomyces mirabilis]|uniref:IF4E-domain-containing protein n=1 Tax=Recurvomyces mirabilis TaxID=574656 RepID=A0AAE1C654_9PEZI|nr:hypothetical protein LTR78_000012 [Recurvomyces mirabilis]KAK5161669.1 hypothetical protein LTS14_000013 [Recurvomyces mirabilis]